MNIELQNILNQITSKQSGKYKWKKPDKNK